MRHRGSFSPAETAISAPGIVIHVSPIGPIALVLLVIALWLVMHDRAPVAAEEPLVAA